MSDISCYVHLTIIPLAVYRAPLFCSRTMHEVQNAISAIHICGTTDFHIVCVYWISWSAKTDTGVLPSLTIVRSACCSSFICERMRARTCSAVMVCQCSAARCNTRSTRTCSGAVMLTTASHRPLIPDDTSIADSTNANGWPADQRRTSSATAG